MGRREWRCRNPACQTEDGALLGRVVGEDGLELAAAVVRFAVYVDTGKSTIWCPVCGRPRDFRGRMICSSE